jgi:preprotein translocase subunit YajC
MMVAFYFIGIRPQQQRAKEQAKMLSAIKSGDKVVTVAGIKGTILSIKDSTVSIRSGDAKLEVTKASIMEVLEAGSDSAITTV